MASSSIFSPPPFFFFFLLKNEIEAKNPIVDDPIFSAGDPAFFPLVLPPISPSTLSPPERFLAEMRGSVWSDSDAGVWLLASA